MLLGKLLLFCHCQKDSRGLVNPAEREELVRLAWNRCLFHFGEVLENTHSANQAADHLSQRVAMVVQHSQGLRGTNDMAIQIREELLAPLQASVNEKDHGEGFLTKFRALFQGLFNRGSSMLPVIDEESCGHRNHKPAEGSFEARRTERLEMDLAIDGSRQRRECVITGILDDGSCDVWNSTPVEDSLDRKSTRLNSSHRCISYAVF